MSQKYSTYGFWFYEELLPIIHSDEEFSKLTTTCGEFLVKVSGTRLRTLKHSPRCVSCGTVGVIWMLQSHRPLGQRRGDRPHLNLWALNSRDELALMTQDHILPKSKGGTSHKDNLQTMCTHCNNDKGDVHPNDYAAGIRYTSSVDGRSPGSTGLLQVRRDAQAVLDALENASKLRDQHAGNNPQFRSEYRYPIGSHPAVSWA